MFANARLRNVFVAAGCILVMLSGCVTADSGLHSRRFTDLLALYPGSDKPLQIRRLTGANAAAVSLSAGSHDVFIMVHPAYSLFFREASKSAYTESKYRLLQYQFNSEARFIRQTAGSGKVLILVLPGNYETESISPTSYISYLNETASAGQSVYYLVSESASSGTISMNDMVDLYSFLDRINAGKVLIGGGFIGRCQRQFYNQASTYLSHAKAYIVPEISVISPDDVSEKEAGRILDNIERRNYASVISIISTKNDGAPIFSLSADQR